MKDELKGYALGEREHTTENNDNWNDSFWIVALFMMMLIGNSPSIDIKAKEDIAELKGKVSVLEKLVTK